eukprot:8174125-Karenia_brevis.AAC.1
MEDSFEIDWTLKLGEMGQNMLFSRLVTTYESQTAMVPKSAAYKKRPIKDNVRLIRDSCAFFAQ